MRRNAGEIDREHEPDVLEPRLIASPQPESSMSPEANDGHDVCLALEGDGEAFGRLIARYQRAVTRLLRPYAGDAARLEELVQETFVEAYFSLGSWRGDGAFGKWIEVIAVRTGYRHLRRQYRDRKISRAASLFARSGDLGQAAAADGSDAADQIAASDESAALLSLLDDLRPR
ncbi:MAG: sigma-70 family RNA polymerase sigma factor, partial [Planctomycetota bacterium]